MPEIRIRNRQTGETFVGDGALPSGYDLVGPAPAGGLRGGEALASPGSPSIELPLIGDLSTLGRMVKESALPMAGALAGGLLGPAGMVGGSMAGEVANQALNVTEPSLSGLVGSAVAPVVGMGVAKGVNALARRVAPSLPGASGLLHEQAAASLPALLPTAVSADPLYALVNQFNPVVETPAFRAAAATLTKTERQAFGPGLKLPGVSGTAEAGGAAVDETIVRHGVSGTYVTKPAGALKFQDIFVNLKRLGAKIRETRPQDIAGTTSGNAEEYGAYKKLYGSLLDDLDAAVAAGNPAMPAVQALKAANAAARREFAVDEIADIMSIRRGGLSIRADLGTMTSGEPQVQVNFNKILTNLKKSEDIQKSLPPADYASLIHDLTQMASIPALQAPRGVNVGSALAIGRNTIGATAGGLLAAQMGADPTIGAMAGGFTTAAGHLALSKLILTQTGRMLLARTMAANGGLLPVRAVALLSLAMSQSPPGRTISETVGLGDLAQVGGPR